MDAKTLITMLTDRQFYDLRKLEEKYDPEQVEELMELLQGGVYRTLPLQDEAGKPLVYLERAIQSPLTAVKLLMTPQRHGAGYGLQAMEEELLSIFELEHCPVHRESVRRVLHGFAPTDTEESQVYAMRQSLEFIQYPDNHISEENIYRLYRIAISGMSDQAELAAGCYYRNSNLQEENGESGRTGVRWECLNACMRELVEFLNQDGQPDELVKAAVAGYYLTYLQPYHAGNIRMARLIPLWYLIRQGYPSALFLTQTGLMRLSRNAYEESFALIASNSAISNRMDITPYLDYYAKNVYEKMSGLLLAPEVGDALYAAVEREQITVKEFELWRFLVSTYRREPFSTKRLERDFANAAYATIRGFVMKFEELGLLERIQTGTRVKYRVAGELTRLAEQLNAAQIQEDWDNWEV